MSWTPLKPANKAAFVPTSAGVLISLSKPDGRQAQAMRVALRPGNIDHPPSWLKPGSAVAVLLGDGDQAGMMRIVPGSDFTMVRGPGRGRSWQVCVKIQPLAACRGTKAKPAQVVEYDHADGWIDIILPKWCLPTPSPIASAPTSVQPPARKLPGGPFAVPPQFRPGRAEI